MRLRARPRRQAQKMKAMFGFLTPQAKDSADPLQNAKTAAAWLRQLPSLDVIGRQQNVIRALDSMRKTQRDIDLNRVGAIEFVDAALGSRSPAAHQAIHRNRGSFAQACRAHLAGAVGDEPGVHARVSGRARRRGRAGRQRALARGVAVAVRPPGPLPRHRRQAARVQVRALDSGEVDRAASDLSAGVRDAV